MMTSSQTPYLHAFYQEALRFTPQVMPAILRYTKTAQTIGGIYVPENSTISYKIKRSFGHDEGFNPNRFLKKESHNAHAPFGLGARACPAQAISKAMFVGIIKVLVDNVNLVPHMTLSSYVEFKKSAKTTGKKIF